MLELCRICLRVTPHDSVASNTGNPDGCLYCAAGRVALLLEEVEEARRRWMVGVDARLRRLERAVGEAEGVDRAMIEEEADGVF